MPRDANIQGISRKIVKYIFYLLMLGSKISRIMIYSKTQSSKASSSVSDAVSRAVSGAVSSAVSGAVSVAVSVAKSVLISNFFLSTSKSCCSSLRNEPTIKIEIS